MKGLELFEKRYISDPRTTLWEVTHQNGTLSGVAAGWLEPPLQAFAGEHNLGLDVRFPGAAPAYITASRTPLFRRPDLLSETVSEALYGERVTVFEQPVRECRFGFKLTG